MGWEDDHGVMQSIFKAVEAFVMGYFTVLSCKHISLAIGNSPVQAQKL
jgi:hypothetical protein